MRTELMRLSEVFVAFLLKKAKKMAANTNPTGRNTLPVLYNINASTEILSQYQHYTFRYCSISDITVVTVFRNVPGSKWQILSNVVAHVGIM